MLRIAIATIFLLLETAVAFGVTQTEPRWSIGPVISREPGISIIFREQPNTAVHVSAYVFSGNRATVQLDMQSYTFLASVSSVVPAGARLSAYYGLGLTGEANASQSSREQLFLRTPLGLECRGSSWPIEVFSDIGANVGPLLSTTLQFDGRFGMRARF